MGSRVAMTRTLLSIICPVSQMAGRLEHLEKWLCSLATNDVQVIIVHDKRDEDTSRQLRDLIDGQWAFEVMFIEGHFGSAGVARNQGLEVLKGEWVCFWDSDDAPHVERVLDAIHSFPSHEVIVGQFEFRRIMSTGKYRVFSSKPVRDLLDIVPNPGLWRFIFRTHAIKGILFPEFPLGEDQAFLAQVRWDSIQLHITNQVLYTYNVGGENQLTSQFALFLRLEESICFLSNLTPSGIRQTQLIDAMKFRQELTLLRHPRIVGPKEFFPRLFRIVSQVLRSNLGIKLFRLFCRRR